MSDPTRRRLGGWTIGALGLVLAPAVALAGPPDHPIIPGFERPLEGATPEALGRVLQGELKWVG